MTYVYRLSDFLSVSQAHGVSVVYLNACWVKAETEPGADIPFEWTSIHELGFMGAFGVGYKMQVVGLVTHFPNVNDITEELDNVSLWQKSETMRQHICSECLNLHIDQKKLLVVPGVMTPFEVVPHAVLSWDDFVLGKIPKSVPVKGCLSLKKPERS
jgi:hypothetical protein